MKSYIRKYIRKLKLFNKYKLIKFFQNNVMANPIELDILPGNNFLVLVPHPDDEILGAGGTIKKLINKKRKVVNYYFYYKNEERLEELKNVNNFCNTQFSVEKTYTRMKLIDFIKNNDFDSILIPNLIENHIEHIKVSRELYFILKNYLNSKNFRIIMYEVWTPHQPNVVIDVSNEYSFKIEALKLYKSQLANKDYIKAISGLNSYRTLYLKEISEYAESFVLFQNVADFLDFCETINLMDR